MLLSIKVKQHSVDISEKLLSLHLLPRDQVEGELLQVLLAAQDVEDLDQQGDEVRVVSDS